MNIHLIPDEKFTFQFVRLIDNYYNNGEHKVFIYNRNINSSEIKSKNVQYITDFSEVPISELKNDKLFIHGFFINSVLRYLFSIKNKLKKRQLVLIIWGADLYSGHQILEQGGINLNVRFHEYLKKRIIAKSEIFMTFASPDFDLIQKWYGAKGKQYDCLYPTNADINYLSSIYHNSNKNNNLTNILLGI